MIKRQIFALLLIPIAVTTLFLTFSFQKGPLAESLDNAPCPQYGFCVNNNITCGPWDLAGQVIPTQEERRAAGCLLASPQDWPTFVPARSSNSDAPNARARQSVNNQSPTLTETIPPTAVALPISPPAKPFWQRFLSSIIDFFHNIF